MQRVLVNGHELAYELRGAGPPVLFVAGLGTGRWVWARQVASFSRKFTTLVYDHRGVGDSRLAAGRHDIADLASDAAGLLSALGVGKTHVVGLSMGGFVAQTLAIERPELVSRLVLCATSFGGPESVQPDPAAWREYLNLEALPREAAAAAVVRYHFGPGFARGRPNLAVLAAATYLAQVEPAEVLARQAEACARFDESGRVGTIQAETLVCHGTADALLSHENARLLAERIPRARLLLYPGAGHALVIERAREWNEDVQRFLDRS